MTQKNKSNEPDPPAPGTVESEIEPDDELDQRDTDLDSDDPSDRRKFPRVKAKLHMVYEDGKTSFKTRVIDISMGGAFLEMENLPKEGTEIRLTPILPDQGGDVGSAPIRGRVVRVVEYDLENFPRSVGGIGVEFSDVSDGERSMLSSIFREGLKDLDVGPAPVSEDDSARTGEWAQMDEAEIEKARRRGGGGSTDP